MGWKIEGKFWGKHSNLNTALSAGRESFLGYDISVPRSFLISGWSCVSSRYQTVHSLSSIPTSLMMNARTCTRTLHALLSKSFRRSSENRRAVPSSNSDHGRHWHFNKFASNCSMQNDEELPTTSPFLWVKVKLNGRRNTYANIYMTLCSAQQRVNIYSRALFRQEKWNGIIMGGDIVLV